MPEHVTITDPHLHECKGTAAAAAGTVSFADGAGSAAHRKIVIADVSDVDLATAAAGDVFTADGAGSGSMQPHTPAPGTISQGMYDYNDLATATTPIALTVPGTYYTLTNDGAGSGTLLSYGLDGVDNVWNTTTNNFFWNDGGILQLGDTVDIRFDAEVTTTSLNTAVDMVLQLGTGEILPIIPTQNFKTTGTYNLVRWFGIYMGSTTTLNGAATVKMSADTAGATVKVNGWYIRVSHKN